MAVPVADTVYRQASIRRLEEAHVLLRHKPSHASGAIYLGGYAAECRFKWYICRTAEGRPVRFLTDLRDAELVPRLLSARGHDLEFLAEKSCCWPAIEQDRELRGHFNNVVRWSVALRYRAEAGDLQKATRFLASVKRLVEWLESRAA